MDFTQIAFAVGRITPQHVALLGTGFLVSNEGLMVTTRHVIGDDDKGLCVLFPKTSDVDTYQDTTDTSCAPVNATLKEVDPIRDLAILSTGLNFHGTLPRLGSFDETWVGDLLNIWGFPHAPEGRCVLTLQNTIVGAKILLASQQLKLKHAIINTQARPGQSGSPVFSPKAGAIVGLLVGAYAQSGTRMIMLGNLDPAELHQTTHCISAEYVRDML
jgi:S1-C subfamily serine protease